MEEEAKLRRQGQALASMLDSRFEQIRAQIEIGPCMPTTGSPSWQHVPGVPFPVQVPGQPPVFPPTMQQIPGQPSATMPSGSQSSAPSFPQIVLPPGWQHGVQYVEGQPAAMQGQLQPSADLQKCAGILAPAGSTGAAEQKGKKEKSGYLTEGQRRLLEEILRMNESFKPEASKDHLANSIIAATKMDPIAKSATQFLQRAGADTYPRSWSERAYFLLDVLRKL